MKKNIIALAFGIFIALLLLEIGLKLANPFKFRVHGNKINLPYNGKWIFKNDKIKGLDKVIYNSRNSLGFRGPMPKKPVEELLSFITIGGSTTECYYVSDTKTWPYILGEKLSKVFKNTWVNNAGFDGHTTFGHIVLLRDYIIKIKPKYAIFLVGGNDIGKDYSSFDRKIIGEKKINSQVKKTILKLSEYIDTLSMALNLYRVYQARKSQFFHRELDLAKLGYVDVSEDKIQQYVSAFEDMIIRYRQRLIEIVNLCKDNDIEPIFLTHPALYGSGIDEITGENLAQIRIGINIPAKDGPKSCEINGKTMWAILETYNDATRSVAHSYNLICIDMAKLMPKSSKYFYDFYHFTNKGCEKFADILYDNLIQKLKNI